MYQEPYRQNAYGQNAYRQNAHGQNPYNANAYGQGAYGQNPYDPNPYGTNGPYPNAPRPYPPPPYPGMPRKTAPPMAGPAKGKRAKPRFLVFLLIMGMLGGGAYLLLNGLGAGGQAVVILHKETIGAQHQGQAVIVRDEQLVDAESITNIDFIAEEGELVERNAAICSVYSSGYNQLEINRLNKVRTDLQVYHRERQSRTRTMDTQLEPIQDTIESLTMDVRTVVQRAGRGSLINLEKQLKDALRSRQEYLNRYFREDATLVSYYEDERAQLRIIESWTKTYTAEDDCLVSFYTDGYETTVNALTFNELKPEQIQSVLAGRPLPQDMVVRGQRPIYRTVKPDVWYVLFLCSDRDWNPSEGQAYKMKMEGFQEYLVDAKVMSSTRVGSQILVRLEIIDDVRPVLNTRTARMVVGEFVDGFSVPIESVIEQGGVNVVVLPDGSNGTFVPVTVISQDQRKAYIRPVYEGSLVEGQRVRASFR